MIWDLAKFTYVPLTVIMEDRRFILLYKLFVIIWVSHSRLSSLTQLIVLKHSLSLH